MREGHWLGGVAAVLLAAVLLAAVLLSPVTLANSDSGYSSDYGNRLETREFIAEMVSRHQFDANELSRLFTQAEKKQEIIDAISRPAEKVLNWGDYRKIFLTPNRIEGGAVFYAQHLEVLKAAEARFGVPAEVITAIIGVETLYGQRKGNYRVVDALATLAFDYPPRGKFFRDELEQFLLLAREQRFQPLELYGSYAGAMGYGQFIASSYRHYAVDFDGDQVADLLNNQVDAIGSVANYLSQHGWNRNEDIVLPLAQAQVGVTSKLKVPQTLELTSKVDELKQAGLDLETRNADTASARLLRLETAEGSEYWVALNNFYAITRYNHSDLYAMAAFQLSREILEAYDQTEQLAGVSTK